MAQRILIDIANGDVVHEGTAYRFERGGSALRHPEDETSWVRWDEGRGMAHAHAGMYAAYPLYLGQRGGVVVLGSSMLEVADACGGPLRLSPTAVAQALCGIESGQPALVEGAMPLLPGKTYTIGMAGVVGIDEPAPRAPQRVREAGADVVERALCEALARRVEGQSMTIALSGGLDSSLLAALAVELGYEVHAVSLRGDEDDADLRTARELARALGLRHREVAAGDEALAEALPSTVVRSESLIWNGRGAAKDLLAGAIAAAGMSSMLTGVGADEMFMGHPGAAVGQGGGAAPWRQRMADDRDLASEVLDPSLLPVFEALVLPAGRDPHEEAREHQLRATLPFSTLVPECRPAASHGVDVRLPFLDAKVAAIARGMASDALVRDGVGKRVLREIGRKRLPRDIWGGEKRPVLARAGGVDRVARGRWAGVYRRWLSPRALERMPFVRAEAVARQVDAFMFEQDCVQLARLDRMLMRLTSASILAAELAELERNRRARAGSAG